MDKDLYEILQVSRNAEQEVIQGAYVRLSKKYHPDLNKNADAAPRMREINAAYEILSDPKKRSDYDRRKPPTPRAETPKRDSASSSPPPSRPKSTSTAPPKPPRGMSIRKVLGWSVTGIIILIAIGRFLNFSQTAFPTPRPLVIAGSSRSTPTPFVTTVAVVNADFPTGVKQFQEIQFACNKGIVTVYTFQNGAFSQTGKYYHNGDEIHVYGRLEPYMFVGVDRDQKPYYVESRYVCLEKGAPAPPTVVPSPHRPSTRATAVNNQQTSNPSTAEPAPTIFFGSLEGTPMARQAIPVCARNAAIRRLPELGAASVTGITKDGIFEIVGKYGDWYRGSPQGDWRTGFINQGDLCIQPNPDQDCDDFLYTRWKNGKSDQYAPPCNDQ